MSTTTGDVHGAVQRVVDVLHAHSYPRAVSSRRLREGDPTVLLPILHFLLLDSSAHVAAFVTSRGFLLHALDDASFTDAVFRLAREHLGVRQSLQARQFLARGFVGAARRGAARRGAKNPGHTP
jgi:hypothetical protein